MTVRGRRIVVVVLSLLVLVFATAACRNETQNRIRRSIQDFTNVRMYISVYTITGDTIFEGLVDGKVTRASARSDDGNEDAAGDYVYWYDDRGRYHQTSLPYLVTTYDRRPEALP
jgi:uncharacterized protein YcfL